MRARTERGYSLVELVIVVTVLATLAAMAMPAPSSYAGTRLDLVSEEIASAMRFAHSEAMRTGQPHGFHVQSIDRRIRVFRLDTGTTPPTPLYDVRHPVSKQIYDTDLTSPSLAAADALGINALFRGACTQTELVYFDGYGTPWCTNPETVLLESFAVTVTLGSTNRVVNADGMTGRVSIQ
ncbi:MAG: prepilin-type N-terminal cleavage/methylation domain-containing protein [Woeseiaceae bacterium]|nr:prepilin-type N-terminal cleavage/methylation domain-containing protein [Woeseiaceae bacterium]